MTLAISISPKAQERLAKKAKDEGVDLPTFVSKIVEAQAASLPDDSREQDPTIALLRKWREEDATDDPEELAKRHREGEEFMRNLAQNRIDSEGPHARKLWP